MIQVLGQNMALLPWTKSKAEAYANLLNLLMQRNRNSN